MSLKDFRSQFKAITGHVCFPWQEDLFGRMRAGAFPGACDIPTGLGKTSVIAVWLLALAQRAGAGTLAGFPRRLVYVVNRRTVVDQATKEAVHLRAALVSDPQLGDLAEVLRSLAAVRTENPIGISTLRGQFADNAEWRNDPARPAVVVGTVDMIGSRLLFSGYGRGFKSRPLHAGFLGQDALLVHDEAHLEPAFQELVTAIESEQRRCKDFRPMRVMALTATSRGANGALQLTDADRKDKVVIKRIDAKKGLAFHRVDEKKIIDEVVRCALGLKGSNQAILIFLRRLDDVEKTVDKLRKANLKVQTLTGTLRGLERDELATTDGVFGRFMRDRDDAVEEGTVYLVCTSAGEVGVNISADHLICDITPYDSMAQRFGRVNRFGNGDARIDVVLPKGGKDESGAAAPHDEATGNESEHDDGNSKKKGKDKSPYDRACERTVVLLQQLPVRPDKRFDASPGALVNLPAEARSAAFGPCPVVLDTSDILFDAWALTSIRDKLPGRPPVADWLHGVTTWEIPQTHVGWRQEVGLIVGEMLDLHDPADLLEDYPLKPHELLRDRRDRVLKHLSNLAQRRPGIPVWLIPSDGSVEVTTLSEVIELDENRLSHATVLLPPDAGGIKAGMLDSSAATGGGQRIDVADDWSDERGARRLRVWDNAHRPAGMRLVRSIDTTPESDEDQGDDRQVHQGRFWRWYVRPESADDGGSRTATEPQELEAHRLSANRYATALANALGLGRTETLAVRYASRSHDLGKDRAMWQRSIGNDNYPAIALAKSVGRMSSVRLNGYRHELGSLLDVRLERDWEGLGPEVTDLVVHLIAAHHGRGRPHFAPSEVFDPEHDERAAIEAAQEVPRRFARMQKTYGRWGLAYLESLVRAADALASQVAPSLPAQRQARIETGEQEDSP